MPLNLPTIQYVGSKPLTGDAFDYLNPAQCAVLVNGTAINLNTSQFILDSLSVSYDGKEFSFNERPPVFYSIPTFAMESPVELKMDLGDGLTTYFKGKIKKRTHSGENNNETISYSCPGQQNLANEVDVIDSFGNPGTFFTGILAKVSEAIQQIFTYNAVELSNYGVPSTIGTPGLEVFGDGLLPEDVGLSATGVTEAIKRLVSFFPSKRVFFDDPTQKWVFLDIGAAPIKKIRIDLASLDPHSFTIDTTNRYTAVLMTANVTEAFVQANRAIIPLDEGWNPNFTFDWTIRKALGLDGAASYGSAYSNVFRRWTFSGGGQTQKRVGTPATLMVLIPWHGQYVWVAIQSQIDWPRNQVFANVPIIVKGNPNHPGECLGPLAAMLVYVDAHTQPSQGVDFIRYPTTGYQGTAYIKYGIQRIKHLQVDEAHLSEYWAKNKLEVLQDVIITADVPISGDPMKEFINLNSRVTLTDSRRPMGIETTYGFLTSYRYQFGRPGKNTISLTTDKSLVTRQNF